MIAGQFSGEFPLAFTCEHPFSNKVKSMIKEFQMSEEGTLHSQTPCVAVMWPST